MKQQEKIKRKFTKPVHMAWYDWTGDGFTWCRPNSEIGDGIKFAERKSQVTCKNCLKANKKRK